MSAPPVAPLLEIVEAAKEYVEWPQDGEWEAEVALWGDNGQHDLWCQDGEVKRYNLLVDALRRHGFLPQIKASA